MTPLLRLVPVLLVPALASASTVWKGDFETGNLSQWTRLQSVASDRLQVVTDVVREGRYALKATVKRGDDPIDASGNRNELLYLSRETPGSEYFYKWSTLFPKNYPSEDSWQVFAQWHQEGCCGSPPLEFYVVGEEMNLRVGGSSGKVLWQAPLERGRWHDFVLRVKWSPDPKVGFVELYHDGRLAVPRKMVATQFGREKNYLKLGLYRDSSISPVGVVYHDGFVMGTSLEDVMPRPAPQPAPPPAEPPPAPQPAPPPPTTPSPREPEPPAPAPQPPAPVVQAPPVEPSPTPDIVPSDGPDDQSKAPAHQHLPRGCGASATGGMPAIAAAGLLAIALLIRRRHALARARAPRR